MSAELIDAMKTFDVVIIYALLISFISMTIVYAVEDLVKHLWKRHKEKKAKKAELEESAAKETE